MRGKQWGSCGAALAAALAAIPAVAKDAPDEYQITVTATRIPIDVALAPATVTVITSEQLADSLTTDIHDLIRHEPGISVTRQPARFGAALGVTGRAGNEGFTVRGIGGNRVLIQVDGVRVPDGFTFGAQAAGRGDYVDVGLVKSVELLRGPASALYGSDGLAGAVSFTTSDPADILGTSKNIGGLARAAYQSASDEFSETGILAGRAGAWSAMVAITRRDFHEFENKGTVGGNGATRTEPNPQNGHSNASLARVVFEPGGGHKLRLTGEYLDSYLFTDLLSGRSATVDLVQGRDTSRRGRVAFDWTWNGGGTLEYARLGGWWQDSHNRQFTDEDRTPAADRERLNTFDNRVYGASAEARLKFATGAIEHRLALGGDASSTRQQGLRDGVVPPAGETFPTRAFPVTDYVLSGLFVADEMRLGPVTLYPALRLDAYDLSPQSDPLLPRFRSAKQHGSRVSPKLGTVVKLTDTLRLFANYARGFKAPEPSQVNQFFENLGFGYTSIPNPDLRPETSESVEAGVRYTSPVVRLEVTGFHADYDRFISQEVVSGNFLPTDPAVYQFVNLDRVRVRGAEARFEARTHGFTGSLALSYAHGDVIEANGARAPLSTIDPLKFVAGAGYREPGGRFGIQANLTHSARKELSRTTGLCSGACYTPGDFTIVDVTAFVRIADVLTLRAGIFNLGDVKYAWWADVRGLANSSTVKDAYTQPGRNGSVSLSFRF